MSEALVIDGLNVARDGQPVLHDVSLTVPRGRTVAVLGPNGTGKSTLLRTVSGLHRPRSGSILLHGRSIHRSSARVITRAGIAHVPEGREVFARMSVLENIEMGGFVRSAKETRRRTAEVFDLFPALAPRRRQPAGLLSGGEQQMLAIGRALVSAPTVLMLDEPSMGLAPTVVADVATALAQISAEGVTILMVEQQVRIALQLADRIAIMRNGRVVADDDATNFGGHQQIADTYLRSSRAPATSAGANGSAT